MRSNLKRVNIVLTREQHQKFKDFAQRYHGSVSQFLRLAAEMEIENGDVKDEVNLRPLVELMDKTYILIQEVEARLERIGKGIESILDDQGNWVKKVSQDIESLLYKQGKGLSIPEMANYLSYSQNELIQGIEHLDDTFAVTKIEQINSPSKWKIRGMKDDN